MNKLDLIEAKIDEIKSLLEILADNRKDDLSINRRLSMKEIADIISAYFEVSIKQMRSDSREGHIMKARHMAKFIMSTEFHYTPKQIGDFINCHRTTVYPTIYRVQNWLETDNKFNKLYGFVMEEIIKKSNESIDT